MSRWIPVLVVAFSLGLVASAHADKRVDWTPYLEKPGARPLPIKPTDTPKARATPRTKKAKVANKRSAKSSSKAKAKAKSKRRARAARKRR